jgi:hypothetical protein
VDELKELQQLLFGISDAVQEIISLGEQIPDDVAELIANEIQWLMQRIEELESQVQQEPPPLQDSMPSSNVSRFAYDDKNQKLYVQFLGKYPNRNGPVYSYDGIPSTLFRLFQMGAIPARTDGRNRWGKWWKGKNPSMGASVYTLLKLGAFPYQRVS